MFRLYISHALNSMRQRPDLYRACAVQGRDLGRYLHTCRKIEDRMRHHFDVCKRSTVVCRAGKLIPSFQNVGCGVLILIQMLAPIAILRWSELPDDV